MLRDEQTVPLVAERFAAIRAYIEAARETLMAGRKPRGEAKRRTRAALGHAISILDLEVACQRAGAEPG